ncbi:hypothetical protein HYP06_gp043 [Vibrio phage vB_VspP_pVa5]|uniref:TMhelix containing protein n=1 Tax=Vibrio phage vB_VspP_pVa5 TaxID=1913109 RepID=A0A1J0GV98_9CAUD|nr:hypothetical protein HYP06_gp043 [Vibrio phage vB_VspP_pVa5]APC46113.1 hypothetical protein vBVspPpVa5_0043 [Vibrio phage vB_VspP_pVa5]
MVNKIVQFMFKPIWNFIDIAIYMAVLVMIPQIGLWVLLPASLLVFLNSYYENKLGWEVYDSSKD